MTLYEFRQPCNDLTNDLKRIGGNSNIIKVSIDVQLPDVYIDSPEPCFEAVRVLFDYLNDALVNGIIGIEFLLNSSIDKGVSIGVQLNGRGIIKPNIPSKDSLDAFVSRSGFIIQRKDAPNFVGFQFNFVLMSNGHRTNSQSLPFSGKHILVAEDNEINALVFTSFLEGWGCESIVAVNGADAITLLQDQHFDLILMDVYMPVLNGNQATERIREFSQIPIIALTASNEESEAERAINAGANEFLLKPVNSSELFNVMSKYL